MISAPIREFVEEQRVARLATVDEFARPHIVPICFALERDSLYSAIDEKPKSGDYTRLRRLRNIAVHPEVQVLFDRYDESDWSRLLYVQFRGHARVLTEGVEHEHAIRLVRDRYAQYRGMALDSRPVIAVVVERVFMWDASPRSRGLED